MKILVPAFAASIVLTVSLLLACDNSPAAAWCNPGRSDNGLTYEAGCGRNPGWDVGGMYSYMFNYPTPYVASRRTIQVVSLENTGSPSVLGRLGWIQYPSQSDRFTWAEWKSSAAVNEAAFVYAPQPLNNFSYYVWYAGAWSAFNGAVFITNPSYHYAFKESATQLDIQDWACP